MSKMEKYKILKVTAAEYVDGYCLMLSFNNGESRVVDFAPLMQKGICRKLQDVDYFKSFSLDHFTVDWHNEIGFAPEFLYERGMVPYQSSQHSTDAAADTPNSFLTTR